MERPRQSRTKTATTLQKMNLKIEERLRRQNGRFAS